MHVSQDNPARMHITEYAAEEDTEGLPEK